MQTENTPRVVFVGDSGVGKTSLIHYAKNGTRETHTNPTIGAGITQMSTFYNGETINYQLWDTAGQEIYRNIVPIYFKGAVCAIVVFSLTDPKSFESLESWIEQLQQHAEPNCGIIIVGNKADVENQKVSHDQANKWADERNYNIIFASAYTGENVDLIVDYVCSKYVAKATPIAAIPRSKMVKKGSCC